MSHSVRELRSRLLAWYDANRRDLPWRRSRDPYAILVSEVMLQQTRVETVIPYFLRFLATYPNVSALATAPEDDVLKLWAGLGYYRRARLLHGTARAVATTHGGRFPDDVAALRDLPGIGRYTAGALASIAFGVRTPLVDGNVARVLSRVTRLAGDPKQRAVSDRLWQIADSWVPDDRPGDFNQALMELGATVCTPKNPRCSDCPIARLCESHRDDVVAQYPTPLERRAATEVRLASCVIESAEPGGRPRIALVKRAIGTKMAGLHDLPALEIGVDESASDALTRYLEHAFGLGVTAPRLIGKVRHTITHHKIAVEVHRAEVVAQRRTAGRVAETPREGRGIAPVPDPSGIAFVERFALDTLGLSALANKQLRVFERACEND